MGLFQRKAVGVGRVCALESFEEELVVLGHGYFQKAPLFSLHLVPVASFQHFYHSGKGATDNPEASGQSCISIKTLFA